eukprot:TRINITY_DN473_c0_g1_i2.p1 TRINITY_DN473_c0_g1~~TRINITY_DN473_c0_g1_i2.p1  ORF type:complete len:384 (-),score=81.57 TRINITY_DN473_c0_g1_i2:1227-2378(-)
MSLTFSQNKENIKNHMVQFLAREGKVSKTFFGLELGTVCRTPTRGRTKLLMDAYPEVFLVTGDTITLRHPSSNPTPDGTRTPETPKAENLSETAHHNFPQQVSNSVSVDSYGSITRQPTWEHDQWYSQHVQHAPAQFTPQNPFPMYSPTGSMTFGGAYDGMWTPNMVFQQPPHSSGAMYSGEFGQQFAQAPFNEVVHKAPAGQVDVKEGELCEYRPPQEVAALDILSQNNGSMELGQLMQKLGVNDSDTVDNGMAYVKEVPQHQRQAPTAGKPVASTSGVNTGNQQGPAGNTNQQEQGRNEEAGGRGDDKRDKQPSRQGGDEEVPSVGAKTVRIGSIHVDNVNIQTVNLHLHVDDMKKSQIGDLVQLQSSMQELFEALTSQKQ